MVIWMNTNDFWMQFKERYETRSIYLHPQIICGITLSELHKLLPHPDISNGDEEDGLGPFDRWFGIVDEVLFFITCYHNNPELTTITSRSSLPPEEKYYWSIIEPLSCLPKDLFRRVMWINGNVDASISVCFYKNNEVKYEVYRASSRIEALELLTFLRQIGSEYKYFVADPENLDVNWLIIKLQSGIRDEIVGRYTLRSVAEEVAKTMSLKSDDLYQIINEQLSEKVATYHRGKINL
jgi:hypothetical protein